MDLRQRSEKVKALALGLGFEACGISKAGKLQGEEERLNTWLSKGYNGKMQYMENHFDKRLNPQLLVPGSQTVISLMYNYYPQVDWSDQKFKIAKYAYGEDYHHVIKDKLKRFHELLIELFGKVEGRVFVDSAPVMERQWAAKAGLGWIGKHGLLLSKQKGSYFFLAELITDLKLEADGPQTDHCGNCRACMEACPTEAIVQEGVVDSRKCISYLTIELKEQIPTSFQDQMHGWVFGCDICQDVCPWNRFSTPHKEEKFAPNLALEGLHTNEWKELTSEVFGEVFKKSAVKRAGFLKLRESLDFAGKE